MMMMINVIVAYWKMHVCYYESIVFVVWTYNGIEWHIECWWHRNDMSKKPFATNYISVSNFFHYLLLNWSYYQSFYQRIKYLRWNAGMKYQFTCWHQEIGISLGSIQRLMIAMDWVINGGFLSAQSLFYL